MEFLKSELQEAYDVLTAAITKQAKQDQEWQARENYLKSENESLNRALTQLQSELNAVKISHQCCDDKIVGTWPMSSLHKWFQIVNKQLYFSKTFKLTTAVFNLVF